ncbi:MAG: carbonic anhydrase family protein [Spirochaetia bacterium]|nr:carbonic anhydrase family protein [Spirochaetia bacterium]
MISKFNHDSVEKKTNGGSNSHFRQILSMVAVALLLANCASAHEWGYEGAHGPGNWGGSCSEGKSQSPIDLPASAANTVQPIQFNYGPTAGKVFNNHGETIRVNFAPGNSITVAGKSYALLQMHYHTPSEHKVSGYGAPLELHLVHKSAAGELAVVGVFLQQGNKHPAQDLVWNSLPKEPGVQKEITINPADFLPASRSYFNYPGSLTTPPCSEGVNWHVMKNPIYVSAEQVGFYKERIPMNSRPVQSLNGRGVVESN